jgi:hypothetical protein
VGDMSFGGRQNILSQGDEWIRYHVLVTVFFSFFVFFFF